MAYLPRCALPPCAPCSLASCSAFLLCPQRCRTAESVCSRPLLAHPTWRSRIAWLHRLVHKLPLLVPEWASGRLPPAEEEVSDCRVFVTSFQLMMGVVSVLERGGRCW